MTLLELYYLLRLWLIIGQAVYWYLLRDDGWDQVVWEACVNPGVSDADEA